MKSDITPVQLSGRPMDIDEMVSAPSTLDVSHTG
jgi:hypothetical protein